MRTEIIGFPLGVGVLMDLLWSGGDLLLTFGTELYTPLAVTSSWIAPEVSWLDTEVVTLLATVAAALYVTNVVINTYEQYTDADE
ncbi:hypothetical protein [Halorubrum sp. F4]|uniref:hypothetical protein n=1 Tax=Halorubrum sp. F4 TaxID=2989715 RepID=UPI0024803F0C|nr:hypothetical protein [Halorubrum sp. F4]